MIKYLALVLTFFGVLGIEAAARAQAEQKEFRGHGFHIYTVDLKKADLKLYWRKADQKPYSTLSAVRAALGPKFLMAANSGIYSQQYAPLGLHIERQKELKPVNKSQAPGGNFSLVPNGIFLLTKAGAQVQETGEYLTTAKQPDFILPLEAAQSGPLLVNKGKLHPKFEEGSSNAKLRNGVGVDRQGRVVFAISDGLVNFYDFALLFRDLLDCPSALYLDGTISKMLTGPAPAPVAGAQPVSTDDQLVPFAGIWAATEL